jgi:DNA invertase Pin-like site-specific DNA recombinase
MVVIWRLDRLSHALQDVLYILVRIDAAGAGFGAIHNQVRKNVDGNDRRIRR